MTKQEFYKAILDLCFKNETYSLYTKIDWSIYWEAEFTVLEAYASGKIYIG